MVYTLPNLRERGINTVVTDDATAKTIVNALKLYAKETNKESESLSANDIANAILKSKRDNNDINILIRFTKDGYKYAIEDLKED